MLKIYTGRSNDSKQAEYINVYQEIQLMAITGRIYHVPDNKISEILCRLPTSLRRLHPLSRDIDGYSISSGL